MTIVEARRQAAQAQPSGSDAQPMSSPGQPKASDAQAVKTAMEAARAKAGALPMDAGVATQYATRAAQLLHGGPVPGGTSLAAVSPRLSYVLEAWRRQSSGGRKPKN